MGNNLQNALALAGRLLFVTLFLPEGIGKIGGFGGTVEYISSAGLPFPLLGACIAIGVEVGGSLALLAGLKARLAAAVMAIFTVAAAVFFHKFWAVSGDEAMVEHIMFFKDLSIAGGLGLLVAFGAGGWSMDSRLNH
jgi:putative oxidoreductase